MSITAAESKKTTSGVQHKIQHFGRYLSGMVMPNIGAFIAWGLITAFFIPKGWMPNANLSKLVDPMVLYLLPLLIGYTGGKAVGGQRGAVLGAIATTGVIVGTNVPMFIGAMIMGPLGGYVIKKFDKQVEGKVPAGFEMLVNNFSAGIIGGILALLAYTAIGPVVHVFNDILESGVRSIVDAGLIPLASLFIEPGKILFLNNAINHGVLGPIGIQEAKEAGKSIFFLLETNPGPGLGILLAYWVFAKGSIKQSAPGAIIIHFIGGIHEIYFPYVLMNPMLILAAIAGGASGVLTFSVLGAGLVATPSPGSIFALLAMTPRGGYIPVLAGVAVATAVSFVVASVFVKRSASANAEDAEEQQLEQAKAKVAEMKFSVVKKNVSRIIFACDAGMGSSAMGATTLKNSFKRAGMDVDIVNCAIEDIPLDAQIVITHQNLTASAKHRVPNAEHLSVRDFTDNAAYESIVSRLKEKYDFMEVEEKIDPEDTLPLRRKNILLGLTSVDKYEAIRMAGRVLVKDGYVDEEYIEAMIERENDLTTYIGKGIAIPHGVGNAKKHIRKSGMVVLQFPEGVDFDGEKSTMVIGIAGVGNEHLSILANIATVIEGENPETIEELSRTKDVNYIYKLFTENVE